jgi:hypothetical protein
VLVIVGVIEADNTIDLLSLLVVVCVLLPVPVFVGDCVDVKLSESGAVALFHGVRVLVMLVVNIEVIEDVRVIVLLFEPVPELLGVLESLTVGVAEILDEPVPELLGVLLEDAPRVTDDVGVAEMLIEPVPELLGVLE